MEIQKIIWKIYLADNGGSITAEDFFKVFNGWIPDSPEVFIDVADYQHVGQGPLIFLVGHYVDYSFDNEEDRYGLVYKRKQPIEGSDGDRIKATFIEMLKAAQKLEADPQFEGRLKFDTTQFTFTVNDRATAPNTSETYERVSPLLQSALGASFKGTELSLAHQSDSEVRFTVDIKAGSAQSLTALIANL